MISKEYKHLLFQIFIACFAALLAYIFSVRKSRQLRQEEKIENIYQQLSDQASRYKSICEIDPTSSSLKKSLEEIYTLFYSKSHQIDNNNVLTEVLKLKECFNKQKTNNQCEMCISEIDNIIIITNKF